MMKLAGIGELLWDIYPESRHLGGAPFNCVHHIKQLGQQGIIVSRIGKDRAGHDILNSLRKNGIVLEYIQIDLDHETGYVTVKLDENAQPLFKCSEAASYDYLEWYDQYEKLIPTLDAVVFGTFAQHTRQAANTTQDFLKLCSNALKVFDVNFRERKENIPEVVRTCLPLTDILKMNEHELQDMRQIYPELPEDDIESLQKLVEIGKLRIACLTVGKWGCLLADGTSVVYCPGLNLQPIDTTGAGDAFITALTLQHYQGAPLHKAGQYANSVAAYTMLQMGATPKYTPEKIYDFISDNHRFHVFDKWNKFG